MRASLLFSLFLASCVPVCAQDAAAAWTIVGLVSLVFLCVATCCLAGVGMLVCTRPRFEPLVKKRAKSTHTHTSTRLLARPSVSPCPTPRSDSPFPPTHTLHTLARFFLLVRLAVIGTSWTIGDPCRTTRTRRARSVGTPAWVGDDRVCRTCGWGWSWCFFWLLVFGIRVLITQRCARAVRQRSPPCRRWLWVRRSCRARRSACRCGCC